MLLLVQIQLVGADLSLFEAYEQHVLALLPEHGGALVERLRAKDGSSETHLLQFPNIAAFDAFRADPERETVQEMWRRCGATSTIIEVERST